MRLAFPATAVGALAFLLLAQSTYAAPGFRAGAAKVDITPTTPQVLHTFGSRPTTGVHDPLFHRALVLENSENRFVLVSSDLLVFAPTFYDEAAERLEATLGIGRKSFWWSVTHTHAAPSVGDQALRRVLKPNRDFTGLDESYGELVLSGLVEAVREAMTRLEPARYGVAFGRSMANVNRRARDADGTVFLGVNPEGPVDRRIAALRFESSLGKPIAAVANYPIHGTVIGAGADYVSADVAGIVSEYVEKRTGAPLLFIQAAAGNIAPVYSVEPDAEQGHLTQFIPLLGDRILEALSRATARRRELVLQFSETTVESEENERIEWPDELAAYARKGEDGRTLIRVPVRFLRLDSETLLWSAPVELFCEIDFAIRRSSPYPNTLFFGYTNGNFGYVPTREAFREGGYEPNAASPFSPRIEEDFRRAVIGHIESLGRK